MEDSSIIFTFENCDFVEIPTAQFLDVKISSVREASIQTEYDHVEQFRNIEKAFFEVDASADVKHFEFEVFPSDLHNFGFIMRNKNELAMITIKNFERSDTYYIGTDQDIDVSVVGGNLSIRVG